MDIKLHKVMKIWSLKSSADIIMEMRLMSSYLLQQQISGKKETSRLLMISSERVMSLYQSRIPTPRMGGWSLDNLYF